MALQVVQCVVSQQSSSNGISVTTTYTSDGVVVRKTRIYVTESKLGFTMDLGMFEAVARQVCDVVRARSVLGQLF